MVEGNVIFNRKNTILMKNLTKTLIMAVLPLMFFGLFTCQPESDPAIYQAESFMDVYPDSAFKSGKTKSDTYQKRKVIFGAKTKCDENDKGDTRNGIAFIITL